MIPFPPIVENRSVPMPAERFFIKQARRFSAGLSVLYKNQCILRADRVVRPYGLQRH